MTRRPKKRKRDSPEETELQIRPPATESPLQSSIGGAIRQVRRNTNDLRADDVMQLPAEPMGVSVARPDWYRIRLFW